MTPNPLPRLPLVAKALAIGLVLLVLVAALAAVRGIVAEREGRLREAEQSVAASLASSQTLLGPIVQRACTETWQATVGEGKDAKTVVQRAPVSPSLAPTALDVAATVSIEPRHRGIFKVNGYVVKGTLAATFADGGALAVPPGRVPGSTVACDAPTLFVALGDARGIRRADVRLDGAPVATRPGTQHGAHPRGFHVPLADPGFAGGATPLRVEIALELVGTGELAFAPVGAATRVSLASDWPHPSFAGRFLPVERTVTDRGFQAVWQLSALATTAPQAVVDDGRACSLAGGAPDEAAAGPRGERPAPCVETFGVTFIDPVDTYSLADRATKYGLLFIAFTFLAVGIVELKGAARVHPVQYLLVGAALAVFFLLLVSLAEHLPFGVAYAAAAAACTLLLAFYGRFVLGGARAGTAFGAGIAALYGVLYVLLQLEQTALLVGSGLVFAALVAAMVATRKLDWYAEFARLRGAPPAVSS